MSDFDRAFEYVLKNEGGFVNREDDSGGPTNMGITSKAYAHWKKVPVKAVSLQDMRTLSSSIVKLIYRDTFWFPLKLSGLESDEMAICIFDCSVLYGPGTATKFAQAVCNLWEEISGQGLAEDGIMGDQTINFLNRIEPDDFINIMHGIICEHIDALVAKNPKNAAFQKGWEQRADKLLSLISKSTNQ